MKLFLLSALWSVAFISYAQQAEITGVVYAKGDQPLSGASVLLEGTGIGTVTDEKGVFLFVDIVPGKYTLKISYTGYVTQQKNIRTEAGETIKLAFLLEENELLLDESLVTATANRYKTETVSSSLRLDARLVDIAQNIVVIDKHLLSDQQIFNVLDGVNRNVSGVRRDIQWDNAYAVMNIRGSRVSGSFRNGIYMYNYVGPLSEDMSYIEKVEFIKGPGSFMLSNNEPGGFYNLVTKKPTGAVKNEVGVSLGSFKLFRGTGDFDGTTGKKKKLLYRVNGMAQYKGSWIDMDHQQRYAIAPVLTYKISDKSSLTAEYTYQHLKFAQMAPYAFSPKGFKDLPVSFFGGDPSLPANKTKDHAAFLIFAHQFSDKWKLNAQLAYSNTQQRGQYLWPLAIDSTGSSSRAFYLQDVSNVGYMGQISVNGKVQTGPVGHKFLIGIDAANKSYFLDHTMQGIGFPNNIYHPVYGIPKDSIPLYDHNDPLEDRANYRGIYTYASLYIHDELHFFNEKLRLTLGGRFSHTNKITGSIAGLEPEITKNNVVTPRVGISGTINPYLSAYGVYDVAFVEQQGSDYFNEPFEPLKGRNLEAGVKASLFKEKLLATLAYYNINKVNALTADADHPGFMRQSGRIIAQGVEVDVMGQIADGLSVVFNYAFTDSRIVEDADPLVVNSFTPGTARHITNGWLQYQLPKTKLKGLGASFGYQYQARRYITFASGSSMLPDDYFRLDAGISWSGNKYKIGLLMNNLLNAYLYTGAVSNLGNALQYYWQTESPRSLMLNATYRF